MNMHNFLKIVSLVELCIVGLHVPSSAWAHVREHADESREEPGDKPNERVPSRVMERLTPQVESSGRAGEVSRDGVIDKGEYTHRVALGGGALILHWRIDEERVEIGIVARTTGWAAIGIEPTQSMQDADMIVGWVDDDDRVVVQDQFSTGRFGPHAPDESLGGTSDILDFGGSEKEGVTTLEFNRRLLTGDENDKPFPATGTLVVIWAIGTTDDTGMKHAQKGKAEVIVSKGSSIEAPILWPIHAVLMGLSSVLLMAGMFIARYRRRKDKCWLPKHKTLGTSGLVILFMGFGVAYYMVSFFPHGHFSGGHAYLGIIALALAGVVPFAGFSIARAGRHRALVRAFHVWIGRTTLVLLIAAGVLGLITIDIL
jgi:hypothetical protein